MDMNDINLELARLKSDRWALQVKQAYGSCDEALQDLRYVQSCVERYWQGGSGSAMFLALDEAINELARISVDLELLRSDMKRHTAGLLADWARDMEDR